MKKSEGFTLIEMVIVMSIFLFVTGAAIGIFISVINNQKAILSEQEIVNQTSYIVEYLSKSLRMAKRDLTGSCLGQDYQDHSYLLTKYDTLIGSYRGIKFIDQLDNNSCSEIYLDNSDAENNVIKKIRNGENPVSLSSNKMKINYMSILINGNNSFGKETEENDIQPRITISLSVQSKNLQNSPEKKIQTTISQRDLNIK